MHLQSSKSNKWTGQSLTPCASSDLQQQRVSSGANLEQRPPALQHTTLSATCFVDSHLFHTPADLVCPITLCLFQDPVCNALGQVYERAALQRHLLQATVNGQCPTDPVSNAALPSLDLVPVWPMRSRAAEYRDSTVRACVQAAAQPDCTDPIRYLRRAAELVLSASPGSEVRHNSISSSSHCGLVSSGPGTPAATAAGSTGLPVVDVSEGTGDRTLDAPAAAANKRMQPSQACSNNSSSSIESGPPGMTVDFAQYLVAHQGDQYDALVLKYFGNELLRSGCPDAASNVFYRLLLEAEDRIQQAEYLQLCLDCWTCSTSEPHQSEGKRVSSASDQANAAIISKLADFVQKQHSLSPRTIVQMLESTQYGAAVAMQLCQVLLERAVASAVAAGPEGSAEAVLGLPGGLGSVLDVLLELVTLGHGQLMQQLRQVQQQVHQLQPNVDSTPAADAGVAAAAAASGTGSACEQARQTQNGDAACVASTKHSNGCRARRWRGGKRGQLGVGNVLRVAAAGTLVAASFANGSHMLLRFARVGPLLYLLRAGL